MAGTCEFIEDDKSFMIRVNDYVYNYSNKITLVRHFLKSSVIGYELGSQDFPMNLVIYLTSGKFNFNDSFYGGKDIFHSNYNKFAETKQVQDMITKVLKCLNAILKEKGKESSDAGIDLLYS